MTIKSPNNTRPASTRKRTLAGFLFVWRQLMASFQPNHNLQALASFSAGHWSACFFQPPER